MRENIKRWTFCSIGPRPSRILFIWLLFAALSVTGLYTVRRLVGIEPLKEHHDVAGFTFGVIGAFYGLLLAFVIVVASGDAVGAAEESLESEAMALSELSRMSDSLASRLDPL